MKQFFSLYLLFQPSLHDGITIRGELLSGGRDGRDKYAEDRGRHPVRTYRSMLKIFSYIRTDLFYYLKELLSDE